MTIYFVTDGSAIKIGYSATPDTRIRDLQIAHHTELKVLGCIEGEPRDEKRLHKQFAHLKVRGEWFRSDPELLDFIASEGAPIPPRLGGMSEIELRQFRGKLCAVLRNRPNPAIRSQTGMLIVNIDGLLKEPLDAALAGQFRSNLKFYEAAVVGLIQ